MDGGEVIVASPELVKLALGHPVRRSVLAIDTEKLRDSFRFRRKIIEERTLTLFTTNIVRYIR